jgi:hypothetical protein
MRLVTLPGVFRPISDTWLRARGMRAATAVRCSTASAPARRGTSRREA